MNNLGAYTTEDGWFWERMFTVSGLIFLGILALLIWGLYTYLKNRQSENKADERYEKDLESIKEESLKHDREYIQAQMRQEMFEEEVADVDVPILEEEKDRNR